MDPEKLVEMQRQMRRNNEDLQSFLHDLDSWESDIKRKDEDLKKNKAGDKQNLPPVRNSLDQKRKKKKKKAPKEKQTIDQTMERKKKIKGYDYRSWDKFDVDKACEEVDNQKASSESEYETDEEWEVERKKLLAAQFKDQGNQLFKEGKYMEAIEHYTKAIEHDSTNAVFPANRAMALLKQEKYAAAELDCTMALSLDESYLKAYHRRGTARAALEKYPEAKQDFEKVLKQDPKNKQARQELEKIERLLNPPKVLETKSIEASDFGMVKAVYKAPEQRSKKPLKRIKIEEIGGDEEEEKRKQQVSSAQSKQSQTKQRITAQDSAQFDLLLSNESISDTALRSADVKPSDVLTQRAPVEEASNRIQTIVESNDSKYADDSQSRQDLETEAKSEQSSAKCNGIGSGSSTPSTSPRVPAAPSTSYQFQADYKVLKNTKQQFYQYFKQIKPSLLPKLFGQSLDSDVLVKIFQTLNNYYLPMSCMLLWCAYSNGEDIYDPLRYLCDVSRFSMTVMFMSSDDKKVLRQLFAHLASSASHSEEEIQKLKTKYQL